MDPPLPPATTGYGTALVQTLLALVAVCVVAWAVLRGIARRGLGGAPGGRIEVLERASLDARRAVFLVRVGPKILLLGASDSGLTTLAELREDELPPRPAEAPAATFAEVLARATGRRPPPDSPP